MRTLRGVNIGKKDGQREWEREDDTLLKIIITRTGQRKPAEFTTRGYIKYYGKELRRQKRNEKI